MKRRSVASVRPAYRDDIGDLQTRRPLPGPGVQQVDPFLFLNHHGPQVYPPNNGGLPFGPHPHRGFETVTFILDGSLAHHDSGGHASVIEAGGVQWMTAGSGLVHAEISPPEFKQHGGALEILQLWVNLPSRLKMVAPHYVGLQQEDIPDVSLDEGRVTLELIAGEHAGETGPVESLTGVFMSVVRLAAGGRAELPAPSGRNVFLYAVSGQARVAGEQVEPWHLVEINHDGDILVIEAETQCCYLFGHADPIGEPVVTHGPFVMNTQEEIVQAVRDYQDGKFGSGLSL
ncbi:pirin family protein [Halomonas chromatireducens]|uniref:Quercetin 2,3-dioxygenase n=1 Tax=Halomonas chromatireducens TaxID=507626 RepID=A0A0X8HFN6_9GAMM|nr:pirin family protein [Halomonas chromatireducens]AMD01700.1 Quercetin 2,3-dioxygenase [Halomonas chromatireducens]